jgi:iron complex outermembrane receptor protein
MFQTGSVLAGQARLDDSPVAFAIASQTLAGALADFQNDSGVNVIYKDRLVQSKTTSGLSGKYSSAAGLKKLLVGTGLTYQVTAENTVVLKENEMVVAQREVEKKEEVKKKEKARRPVEIEQMTVTAQKQEENVQEVPVSITVFGEQDIEDRKIESIRELADFVPNLMIYQHGVSGINGPTMRGITAAPESFRVSTGLYVDGVPVLTASGFVNEMLDIERIEVLRGPQGTIYGKGTEAGAINIITRQPDNEFRGRVSAEGGKLLSGETGDREKGEFSLNLSGPILKDRLFFSIAGLYSDKDGFIENTMTGDDVNDRERWFGRVHLRWTPVDDLDISLIASRLEYDDGGPNMNMGENGAAMFGLPAPEDRKVTSNLEGWDKSSSDSQSLKITYDISDSLTVTSVTARRIHNDYRAGDYDFSPATLMHSDQDSEYSKVSQELRLNYSAERLKWLVGLYYDRDDFDIDYEIISDIPPMAGPTSRDIDGDTYAVFTNLTYPLTKRLSLITGLRYEYEEQDFEDNISHLKADESWNEFSPKIALEYRFTPAIMTYASASHGYRSGGFNWAATDPQYISYDEEKLWSYEIGAKSAFLNNRLIINGSVFYMEIDDMQVNEAVSPMETYVTNAAEATGKGVELEITARPCDGLSLMAGFGYTDIEFDDFKDALGDYEDNENPWAPEYTFNIGAQYRHYSGFYVRADLIGYGKMYFDKANEYSRDAYEIVNAKIGYEAEHFDIYLYGKNLFDKEYDSDEYFGGFSTMYSDPGEVGLQAVYRF